MTPKALRDAANGPWEDVVRCACGVNMVVWWDELTSQSRVSHEDPVCPVFLVGLLLTWQPPPHGFHGLGIGGMLDR